VPIAENVIKVDVKVQPHPFKEIDASSKEYQIVKMTGMMNFHIDPSFVNDLYQKVGLDFADKVIDPAFNDFVKEVVPTYPIGEILPKREEIRQRAMKKLGDNLSTCLDHISQRLRKRARYLLMEGDELKLHCWVGRYEWPIVAAEKTQQGSSLSR
jgi:regulator of protease activity HflC (stomatin/prohibitin superfamily)